MRTLVRQLLLAHSGFVLIYPAAKLIQRSAVVVGEAQEPPFAVISMGVVTKRVGSAVTRSMTLWCHDAAGDYGQIDLALQHARVALDVWGLTSSSGGSLIRSEWTGEGEDAYDDGFNTIVRTGQWDLTGTGA